MEKEKEMADYDLSKTIIPYLDRHLAFPLLAHLVDTALFPVEQVQSAQYELAKGTNMVDYAVSLFEQLHPGEEVPPGKIRQHLPDSVLSFVHPK
jgi:translation initiation factor 3 subunit E